MPEIQTTNGWGESKRDVYHRLEDIENWKCEFDGRCMTTHKELNSVLTKISNELSFFKGKISGLALASSIVGGALAIVGEIVIKRLGG